MWHVDLASPLVHAWYKNSPSGWIHQLLQLSSYEIDKILSFVKYIVVKGPDEKWKDYMKETLKSDFNIRLSELDEIYREEEFLYQAWTNGEAKSTCPILVLLVREDVTSTLHFSQTIHLYLGHLYFPQLHSKFFTGPKIDSQKRPPAFGLPVL